MATFAEKELEKYGWTKGMGLGVGNKGISKPVSVGIKTDNQGLGNDTEWSNSWWDHSYNKAAANIVIDTTEQGDISVKRLDVQVKRKESLQKTMLYNTFVKAGDLKKIETEKDYSIKITDKELFKACGGRVCRKGARGEQPGKIKRVKLADSDIINADLEPEPLRNKKSKKSRKSHSESKN